MSHPDPLYDADNSYEDDMNYDEDECEGEIVEDGDYDEDECDRSDFDESMDGDFESGMASAGWGTDEDYE